MKPFMFRLATPPDISERELVDRCRSADQSSARRTAQRLLFERYKRAMYSTAFRILNDEDHAHDTNSFRFSKDSQKVGVGLEINTFIGLGW